MKEEYYFPNQFIFKDEDVYEPSIMYIISGQGNLLFELISQSLRPHFSFYLTA